MSITATLEFAGELGGIAAFALAHNLFPPNGNRPLSPLLIVRRLEAEFAYIEADEAEGLRRARAIMNWLEARIANRIHSIHQERLERLRAVVERCVYVHFGDDPSSEIEFLCTTLIPAEPLVFRYESAVHERAARPLLRRCASVLGYAIGEAAAEPA